MDAINWCSNTFKNEKSQKFLEEKVESLLLHFFKDMDDYKKEKAIKSFSEGLGYLESLLLYQRGIHPQQLNREFHKISLPEYQKKYQEVESTMETEIKRQFRHFTTFLA